MSKEPVQALQTLNLPKPTLVNKETSLTWMSQAQSQDQRSNSSQYWNNKCRNFLLYDINEHGLPTSSCLPPDVQLIRVEPVVDSQLHNQYVSPRKTFIQHEIERRIQPQNYKYNLDQLMPPIQSQDRRPNGGEGHHLSERHQVHKNGQINSQEDPTSFREANHSQTELNGPFVQPKLTSHSIEDILRQHPSRPPPKAARLPEIQYTSVNMLEMLDSPSSQSTPFYQHGNEKTIEHQNCNVNQEQHGISNYNIRLHTENPPILPKTHEPKAQSFHHGARVLGQKRKLYNHEVKVSQSADNKKKRSEIENRLINLIKDESKVSADSNGSQYRRITRSPKTKRQQSSKVSSVCKIFYIK